jgi:hypothetical protein
MIPELTKLAMDVDDGDEPKIDENDNRGRKWQWGQN